MSTALYRRYRPETFAEVIGQEQVTEPLMTALKKDRVNHAYLFSGPRGCGKTTSARILARCLNCAQGPTPTPCGVCDSCRELSRDGGGSLDVIEMDAASHGGVDHARDLRERATLAPIRDRYKIFIIDEAHMVTREGFNALLKIVEEPPEHIKFIFATTEPNKVLGTIRSRTHHYPFRLVPPEVLLPYLQSLCDQEQVAVEPGVLQLVIRAGGGSVRDSLSILDQLMAGASSENGIEYDRAVALLGYTHAQLLDEVIDALGSKDASSLFGAVSRVVATGQDPRRFVEDLLERLRDLIVVKAVPESAAQILQGVPQDQLERLVLQTRVLGERELTMAASTVNDALNGMTGATNPQLQLELLCARLLLPVPEGSADGAEVATLASRLQILERKVASVAVGTPTTVTPSATPTAQVSGMSAARAAGMAAAGLTPKGSNASASGIPVPRSSALGLSAPDASRPSSGQTQPRGPLADAPLAGAALQPAPVRSSTGGAPPLAAQAHPTQVPPVQGQPAAATQLKPLNPHDPLAAVQGNWRAIINRMSIPGAVEQLAKVYPARMDGTTLYVRADIATLHAVKSYVPELTVRVGEFLRGPVTIHAEVVKSANPQPAVPIQAPAQPAAPAPTQMRPAELTVPTETALSAPLAEGPRGGEDAWRRHGQPLNSSEPPAAMNMDAPLGAWEVAQIPQSEENPPVPSPATPAPAEPVHAKPPVPAGPLASAAPLASVQSAATPLAQPAPTQTVPTAPYTPAGGFGERDSFAASGSGVPLKAPATQEAPMQDPPYEEEPPFADEPPHLEPRYPEPSGPLVPAGPLAPTGLLAQNGTPIPAQTVTEPETQNPRTSHSSAEVASVSPVQAATEEDYISEDDEKVESNTFIGLRAIEKIIGCTVIDERPLHQL